MGNGLQGSSHTPSIKNHSDIGRRQECHVTPEESWGSWRVLAGFSGALGLHLAAASPQAGSEPWPGMTVPYDHSAPKQRLGLLVLALPAGTAQSAGPHLHPTSTLPGTRGMFRWKPSGFTCTRPGTLHGTTSSAPRQHFRHQVII